MTNSNIVIHEYKGFQIPQREADQYVCLTAMAQAEGKQVNDYLRLASYTQLILKDFASVIRGFP